ncbi:MAG: alanine racemase [Vicingaceae bacterium]
MSHTSHIELHKEQLRININYIKSHLPSHCRYSAVIKGNAYGHGIEDILPLMEECGLDHFSVFSVEEAVRANRVKSKQSDLMIMGFIDEESIAWAIESDISFYVFTQSRLEQSILKARELGKAAKIHLELETGMNRTGFRKEELPAIVSLINDNPDQLEIEGICTHLAGAESITNFDRIQCQIKSYHSLVEVLKDQGISARYLHIACSAGVLNYPETQLDLVRVGISNYGYWPSNELRMSNLLKNEDSVDPLEAVLSWKSSVMSLKKVPEGEYVSYGKSYLTNRHSVIASVPIGYGYGFSRDLSNLGRVLVREQRVPVIGVVNMNMMLVDVTDIEDVEERDEVVIIGKQGKLQITVSSFSDMNNSLNYELLTRLPEFIPRKVIS